MLDFINLIEPALISGVTVKIYVEEDGTKCIDLNTEAKSWCILKSCGNDIYAHMRYDKVIKVESFNDVLKCVRDCCYGRSFFNKNWIKCMDDHHVTRPVMYEN